MGWSPGGFFERAAGELPAHSKVIATTALLHDRFEIVPATGTQRYRRGALVGFLGPLT